MNPTGSLNGFIQKFGMDVRACADDGWTTPTYRAFLQPLRYKNKMYLEGLSTRIGFSEQGYYLYIGPAGHDLTKVDKSVYITAAQEKYQITHAERVYFGQTVLYVWAILKTLTEDEG